MVKSEGKVIQIKDRLKSVTTRVTLGGTLVRWTSGTDSPPNRERGEGNFSPIVQKKRPRRGSQVSKIRKAVNGKIRDA